MMKITAVILIQMPIGFHLLSRPTRSGTGLRPTTQRYSAVSVANILAFLWIANYIENYFSLKIFNIFSIEFIKFYMNNL